MRGTTVWIVVLTVLVTLLVREAFSNEEGADQPKAPTPEQMQKHQAAAQPGPEHKLLARMTGEWDTELKIWMSPAMKQPMVMKSSAKSEMILGGRFLRTSSATESPFGKTETLGIMGCDRRDGTYTTIGFDTMGTYGVSARGKYDEATKTFTLHGTDRDPILDHTQKYKFVTRLVSDDKFVVSVIFTDKMHTKGLVDEFKMVEITYTRKAKAAK